MKKTLKDRILELLEARSGLTDRQITDILLGPETGQQAANQAARQLYHAGRIVRTLVAGILRNHLPGREPVKLDGPAPAQPRESVTRAEASMTEDQVKEALRVWLEAEHWVVAVKLGHDPGIDVAACRDGVRRVIEAKGAGKHDQMRGNFFLRALGELVRRMEDPDALDSLAVLDLAPYRRYWRRLPTLAKQRMRLSALFVTASGCVDEVAT
jgi:hypothetical protein